MREEREEGGREGGNVCVCVCAPKPRVFSTQKLTHPSPFHSITPLSPNHQNGLLQAAQEGLLIALPVSLPPSLSLPLLLPLPSTEDTPVLKVCHNNGSEEELFRAQPRLTQLHTDPRQTYIVKSCNSQRVPTRIFCHSFQNDNSEKTGACPCFGNVCGSTLLNSNDFSIYTYI